MNLKLRIPYLASATIAAGIALAGLLLLLPQASRAQPDVPMRITPGVLYVAPDGDDANTCITFTTPCRTIQAAVDSATTGDTIRVASGVYTDVSARAGITQVVYISKSVIIQGGYTATNWATPYPITQPTTLDAQGKGRVVYVTGNISPTVEGLRITGGDALHLGGYTIPGGNTQDAGGGIYVITATINLSNCTVFGNTAPYCSGIYMFSSTAQLSSNAVFSNTSGSGGGGVTLISSTAILSDNAILSNTAFFGAGGGVYIENSVATLNGNLIQGNSGGFRFGVCGGVFICKSTVILNDNVIRSNTGLSGGGVLLDESDATLDSNIIQDNIATGWGGSRGGGLDISDSNVILSDNIIQDNVADGAFGGSGGGVYLEGGNATLSGNTILDNQANGYGYFVEEDGGGGVYLYYVTATLVNNIIADNRANFHGSGVYIVASNPRFVHNTIVRNTRGDGSGIYVTNLGSYHSDVVMTNTILVSHTTGVNVTAGNTATLDATLWGSGDWVNRIDWGGQGVVITGTHNYWGNPAFVAPDVGDYHISSDSAAWDAGIDTSVNSDIDGDPRPMGHSYDIGADELPVSLRLAKHATPNPVQTGASLTWILRVTNTGGVNLHATITDSLPTHITTGTTSEGTLFLPGETITWTPIITAPGGVWTQQVVVTVEMGHVGPLPNVVQVTTVEGASGAYTETATVVKPYAYLPLILRQFP